MRKFVVLTLALCAAHAGISPCFASKNNTGCGIGTMIFEGKDGLVSQVSAATTNGIFGNQTFGITSGTLECEKAPTFASNQQLNKFVGDNMANLAMDVSKGNGEYLSTLAALMDVPVAERPELYRLLQANFAQIYSSENVTQIDVLNNIEALVSKS